MILKFKKIKILCLGLAFLATLFACFTLFKHYKAQKNFETDSKKIKQDIKLEKSKNEPFILNEEPEFTSDFPGAAEVIRYACSNDFQKLYKNLISNLDEESVETVNRILSRFQQINRGEPRTGFTGYEIGALSQLKRNFKIIKLSEDCFAWKEYLLPIDHFEPSVFFYQNGITSFDSLDSLKSKSIVDVGGFIGDSALIFSKYTNKNVYSFEPSSKNFDLMKKTIAMNSKNNIVPVKLGLGSKNQEAQIPLKVASNLKTDQDSKEKFSDSTTETIRITTLDQYVNENKLGVGLIKVDIEGNEQDFLKGAYNTIKNQKPLLLISIYHNPSDFFNIKPLLESWNLKYDFKIVKCVDGQICAETLLVGTPQKK